jgi:hypothetical protein
MPDGEPDGRKPRANRQLPGMADNLLACSIKMIRAKVVASGRKHCSVDASTGAWRLF